MNLIFEPDKLFTTIEVWNNEVERDTFLSSLLDVLDYVNNHDDITFYGMMKLLLYCGKQIYIPGN